jgi:histone chaperone ASF1
MMLTLRCRDTEESAPAEFPPDQPEADLVEEDGINYGAEERELEEALIKEEAALKAEEGDDEEMVGAEGGEKEIDDDESEAGSEDLEAESSGSEDEEEGEEEAEEEGDGDEEMDLGEDGEGKAATTENGQQLSHHPDGVEVMAH